MYPSKPHSDILKLIINLNISHFQLTFTPMKRIASRTLTILLIFLTSIATSQKNKVITDGKRRLEGFESHKTMKASSA